MTTHEPVAIVNLVLSVIRSGLAFAVGMNWIVLTPVQMDQALVFAAAVFLLVDFMATFWMRSQVTPVDKFPKPVQEAIKEGEHSSTTVKPVAPPPMPPGMRG